MTAKRDNRVEIVDGKAVGITKRGKRCKKCLGLGHLCGMHKALGRRVEKRHEVQCKACQHPAVADIEKAWLVGDLNDEAAADLIGSSTRAWQRHAHYKGLYEQAISESNSKRILGRIAQRAARNPKVSPGDGIRAIREAQKIEHGGERVKLTLTDIIEINRAIEAAVKEGKLPAEVLGGDEEKGEHR